MRAASMLQCMCAQLWRYGSRARYFNAELISENSLDSLVPREPRMVTRAMATREAISAYSMAVAPHSSFKNSRTNI